MGRFAWLALLFSACADDPAVSSSSANRVHAVATASADVETGNDTTIPDTSTPGDTVRPEDTVSDTGTVPDRPDAGPDVGPITGPRLTVPATLALPFVLAGGGSTTGTFAFDNLGGGGRVTLQLTGASALSLVSPPSEVSAGEPLEVDIRFAGSASSSIAEALLRVTADGETHEARVFAVAGRALPAASWSALTSGRTTYGQTATVKLDTAPFPDSSASWTDASVNIFVPEGLVDRGPVEYVVHFHGHGTTVASTLQSHRYREQLWASGVNAVLVTPQGPIEAASGNFGKLMRAGGLSALLADVTTILYRDGIIVTPHTGNAVLTEHSGGYQAVALNLASTFDEGLVTSAHLFDGLYGYVNAYEDFARAGGFLRSNHTSGGGTRAKNLALLADLGAVATDEWTAYSLRADTAVIWPTAATHSDSTWWEQGYSETLRWGLRSARHGPRIELRTAVAENGRAFVSWLSPEDDFTTGFRVETSSDGSNWSDVATTSGEEASFAVTSGRWVRVVPIVEDVTDVLPSDSGHVEDNSRILVVDGFDRILGGSWTELRHDHAGRVAALAGACTASNEAVAEGEIELGDFEVVIWLLGDESVADHTFTAAEQAIVTAYLDAGGRVIVSGSEVAYDLKSNGVNFLSRLGAVYIGDDANQNAVRGIGALSAIGDIAFGGPNAPYIEDFPDILGSATGASTILQYANGMTAAVGRPGKSAVLGFPLETVEEDAALSSLLRALVGYVAP